MHICSLQHIQARANDRTCTSLEMHIIVLLKASPKVNLGFADCGMDVVGINAILHAHALQFMRQNAAIIQCRCMLRAAD